MLSLIALHKQMRFRFVIITSLRYVHSYPSPTRHLFRVTYLSAETFRIVHHFLEVVAEHALLRLNPS
jgi:hypothetical protein